MANIQSRKDLICSYLSEISFVQNVCCVSENISSITLTIDIYFDGLSKPLLFDVIILSQYPFKIHESESIIFINKDLVSYSHVMANGNICIHTRSNPCLEKKIRIDLHSLKSWIEKYFLNNQSDYNYEHIVVEPTLVDESYWAFYFTDCEYNFRDNQIGDVEFVNLSIGNYKRKPTLTYLIKSFNISGNIKIPCKWSSTYRQKELPTYFGKFIFLDKAPVHYNKFAFDNWKELAKVLPNSFANSLYIWESSFGKENTEKKTVLFIGYPISNKEIHWQVIILKIGSFPLVGIPERKSGVKTGNWISSFSDEKIAWGITRNTSYNYFYGRGAFVDEITSKKILVIGIGALGSNVATTLVRCGCQYIDFIDYDQKEPENVSRSEYFFANGNVDKTEELNKILSEISPFVNINPLNNDYFEMILKNHREEGKTKADCETELNHYDFIFDCSTDNDLMYLLNSLNLQSKLINMSITNHSKELVCAFSPNIFDFVNNQFTRILDNESEDLYEPVGCWSPTFKASYNDISVMVQIALKRINLLLKTNTEINNFVVQEDTTLGGLKIIEY